MCISKLRCAAAALLVLVAAPASAQAVDDVRCLLAGNAFVKAAKDDNAKRAAEAVSYFYLGRVHGRLNAAQLKAAIAREQKALNAANAPATMNSCTRNVEASAKLLQQVGQELSQAR